MNSETPPQTRTTSPAGLAEQRKNIEGLFAEGDNSFYDGQDDVYNHILSFIESL